MSLEDDQGKSYPRPTGFISAPGEGLPASLSTSHVEGTVESLAGRKIYTSWAPRESPILGKFHYDQWVVHPGKGGSILCMATKSHSHLKVRGLLPSMGGPGPLESMGPIPR